VALIVGAVGVANIMIISVLERRSEIGLRRALGATKAQIRTQFLAESICSPPSAASSACWPAPRQRPCTPTRRASHRDPAEVWSGGIASAILIGAFAGLMPAIRASRMPPTVALRTV
jgi:putative ABC transport system permease protein